MNFYIVFSPEAEEQLAALYGYIAGAASPNVAAGYVEAIVQYCESLATFPHRGTKRDDIRPGLRITHYKKRCSIAFAIHDNHVSILGVFYGGRDYESILSKKG